ncbi:MAG: hypothetical protein R3291_04055 [Thermoplasmata archaeon]|nr:hypothetical protein [Thermoplasmata archaeon]
MAQVLGVLTEDFRLYHDLISFLKERDVPFQSLSYDAPIPLEVGVVLTSAEEAPSLDFPNVVAVEQVADAVVQAQQLLRGKTAFREIVIGIDPGPRPGAAILGDREVIDTRTGSSPEAVLEICLSVLQTYACDAFRVRVGHGDPTHRNRIINVLTQHGLRVEIVDERGTTRHDRRRQDARDIEAAIDIAMGRGVQAESAYEVLPTPGEVKNIQRSSRIRSGGRLTISQGLAEKVARGEMTLAEAIQVSTAEVP